MLFSSDRRSNRYRRIWVGDRGTTHSASSGGVWRDLALWANTPSLGQEAPRQDGIGEACSECEQRLCEYSCPLQLLSYGWQLIGCHSLSPLQFQLEPLALEPSVGSQECASSSWRILILQDLLVVSSQCRWRARATRLRQPQKDLWHRCLDIDSVVEFRDFRWKCSCSATYPLPGERSPLLLLFMNE
jgi:hypothetical protein